MRFELIVKPAETQVRLFPETDAEERIAELFELNDATSETYREKHGPYDAYSDHKPIKEIRLTLKPKKTESVL